MRSLFGLRTVTGGCVDLLKLWLVDLRQMWGCVLGGGVAEGRGF